MVPIGQAGRKHTVTSRRQMERPSVSRPESSPGSAEATEEASEDTDRTAGDHGLKAAGGEGSCHDKGPQNI